MGHFLRRENVYYTSIKTTIVMLETNGIVSIDDNHNAMYSKREQIY
ncbi:hypothetical protein HMPREF1212_01898 [Parabacteroides sp. HGS0025]|jgi:hypothetical protein|nr:hypothetical protein HMPREF1212_01898 [Parabacteroides sp. HGS0025]